MATVRRNQRSAKAQGRVYHQRRSADQSKMSSRNWRTLGEGRTENLTLGQVPLTKARCIHHEGDSRMRKVQEFRRPQAKCSTRTDHKTSSLRTASRRLPIHANSKRRLP